MAEAVSATVTEAAARSVVGNSTGGRKATSGSWAYADLTQFKGRYVEIMCETNDLYCVFVATTSTTPTTSATSDFVTADVAKTLAAGESIHRVVPKDKPYLAYKQVSSAGNICIWPS